VLGERHGERDHEFWRVRFKRRSSSQNGRQNRANQMWESYKEQEEFGKDVLKQFQNHISKIPLPSIKQVITTYRHGRLYTPWFFWCHWFHLST
jgi:hypothetical protein